MATNMLDPHLLRRAFKRLAKDHGWEFMALKDDEGTVADEDRFYQVLRVLVLYVTDEIRWDRIARERKNSIPFEIEPTTMKKTTTGAGSV